MFDNYKSTLKELPIYFLIVLTATIVVWKNGEENWLRKFSTLTFPKYLACILILLGLTQLCISCLKKDLVPIDISGTSKQSIALIVSFTLYVGTIEFLGYYLATLLFFISSAFAFKKSKFWLRYASVFLIWILISHFFFEKLLNIQMPGS